MRPEKVQKRDMEAAYPQAGIPAKWVAPLQKAGYLTLSTLAEAQPAKLHQELCGINKKYKLNLANPTLDEISAWIEQSKNQQ